MVIGLAAATAAVAAVLLLGWVVRGPFGVGKPEVDLPREVSARRLESTVRELCGDLSPRTTGSPHDLGRVADWIGERFRETGLEVEEQSYRLPEGEFRNVLAHREGSDPGAGTVIVGAHYDAWSGLPGADDNASGVAVLLELARTLPDATARRTRLFAAFANEEPPYFPGDDMGSHRLARRLVEEGVEVDLMVALDLVGYYSDDPGSQRLPLPLLRLFYPIRGDFVAVVGDLGAGRWIGRVRRGMRAQRDLPVHSFRGPRFVPGVDWSDHRSFRRLGLPGVLVTDTALMRNPHYHEPTDTPETLDYAAMAAVVRGLHGVLADE